MKKSFALTTILSITTDRLITEPEGENDNGIGRMYMLLEHMTGSPPFTHQLPAFADRCKPKLFEWFPELGTANACLDKLAKWIKVDKSKYKQEGIKMWVAELKIFDPRIQDTYEINQIEELIQ